MKKEVELTFTVEVDVKNPNVIDRVVQNQNDEGVPQPRKKGGDGWQDYMYDMNEEEVYQHLAWNYIRNHLRVNNLDGWADCDESDVEYKIVSDDVWVLP